MLVGMGLSAASKYSSPMPANDWDEKTLKLKNWLKIKPPLNLILFCSTTIETVKIPWARTLTMNPY